ncbi:hypothetical protein M441DRAFT_425737 [Trichoderma asperellum CBS 433.97]|uniref:Secreted protein n=1 Tax=Trichoderma asperellum (strain ATCC 204424 / CBS 433.97 / NBRC 101777) TaxID=1042311 RepID=A0A2T3Z5M5_TRIA4|nr:hypothetical protein M441DRAFT_425737 [Trichoderma asperellum CBS 433.97]PTB40050.1 hypothetical protein M441DRAFT_425737 [Trichoderma asperellum CBS 433.97]
MALPAAWRRQQGSCILFFLSLALLQCESRKSSARVEHCHKLSLSFFFFFFECLSGLIIPGLLINSN